MTTQVAFLFPGQGSQSVGMGADIYAASTAAKEVFTTVDNTLDISLSTLCFQGPEDSLRETINAQPAIVTVSLAILAAFQEALSIANPSSSLVPDYVAGHSVGEWTALVAAGAIDLRSALAAVRERGRLMEDEGSICPGGMAAIIGLEAQLLQEICTEATARAHAERDATEQPTSHPGLGHVVVANYNAPGQIVISGEQHALALAAESAKAHGAKRVMPLAVSGAFHSPVMQPAACGLAQVLAAVDLRTTSIPIIGNIDGTPLTAVEALRNELTQQVAVAVQWIRSIEYMVNAGVTTFIEIGPGKALTGMVKRIARGVTTINIGNATDIAKAVAQVRDMGLIHDV